MLRDAIEHAFTRAASDRANGLTLEHYLAADQRRAHLPRYFEPEERRVLALALQRHRFDSPMRCRIENTDIRVLPDREMPGVEPEDRCRVRRETRECCGQRYLF